jgi:osmoprotectant transport system permease protein
MVCVVLSGLSGCGQKAPDIVVGAKDYTEQYILGNILMLFIEGNTDLNVAYKNDLSSDVIFASLRTGVVDLYVEYTGTVYGNYFKFSDTKCAEGVHEISVRELRERYDLHMQEPLGFNNTYSLAVRADTAAKYDLRTFSNLAQVSSNFIFGGSAEILTRFDGLHNLKRLYNKSFKDEIAIDGNDRYIAIYENIIQVAEVFSTDGMLLEFDLIVLEDDMEFFPPYQGAVIIRGEIAEKYPELVEALAMLNGIMTDETMRSLNHRVDVLGETPKSAAEYFLRAHGLIR